jgi:hypothetical protein
MKNVKQFIVYAIFLCGLASCARQVRDANFESIVFQEDVPEVKPTFVRVDVRVSFDSLTHWLNRVSDRALFKSTESGSFLGFPMEIAQQGPLKISAGKSSELVLDIPTVFDATPQVAGFSAGKIHGKMQVKMASVLNLSDFSKASVSNLAYSYQWIEKPNLKVAGFPINAAPVVDQLLASKKDLITSGLQDQLNVLLEKRNLEGIFQSTLGPFLASGNMYHFNVFGLQLRDFQINPLGISAQCWIQSNFNFHPMRSSTSVFFPRFVETRESESRLTFRAEIPWLFFEDLMKKEMDRLSPLYPTKVKIQANGEGFLTAKISGFQGNRAEFKIDFLPLRFSDGRLGIQVKNTQVGGLEGVKAIFSKKIERKIMQNAQKFRFDAKGQVENWLNQNRQMSVVNPQYKLETFRWNTKGFYVLGEIGGYWTLMK